MEQWESMYRSYINISSTTPVFQQERCVEGPQTGNGIQTIRSFVQSTLYKKYFTQANTTYVGVGNRRRGKPNKEFVNTSFSEFIGKNKHFYREATYRQFIKNADAEYKSVSKYDRGQPNLDEAAWQLSKEWTIRHFGPGKMAGSVIVSREMAQQEMDKTTSPGWPHNLKHKNKTTLFADIKHSTIIDDYWSMIGRICERQEWVPIWQCSEKTELRLKEKIDENKVRTFTCAPVEHSVALNRVCLDMNNKFYNSNNKTWSFVGANKFDSGFHRLWQRLSKHPNAFELDESAYDSSLFLRAMADMVDIRYEFLSEECKTPENRNRLENLYESIIHSVIIMQNGEMFRKHTGNPSGSANTIVDNTIILFRLVAYAWIVLTRKYMQAQKKEIDEKINNPNVLKRTEEEIIEEYGYGGMMAHVEAALNGDDNTFTVSNKMVSIFNATTIAGVWSEIGVITNTPNDKFGQKVEDVNFLSQSFSLHRGLYLPTPDTGKVYSSLMYGSDHDDPRWHLLRACALRIDSWANVEMRSVIKSYIEYLWQKYKLEFSQDCVLRFGNATVNMVDIMAMYRTDDWIFRLYSSHESTLFDQNFTKESLAFMMQVVQTKELSSDQIEISLKQSTIMPFIGPLTQKQTKKLIKKQNKKKILNTLGKKKIKLVKKSLGLRNVSIRGNTYRGKRIVGKGDYSIGDAIGNFMPWNDDTPSQGMVNKGARGVGTAIGDIFGVGKQAGNAASWLSRAFGFGDYAIRSNTLANNNIAQFASHGTIEFAHREFIGDISSSTGFVNTSYPINPGNETLFPWLSTLAKNFEQYQMLGLIFEFKSTSATAVGSTNTGLGTVIMATDYDVLDDPYVDKRSMEVSEFATSAAPFLSQVHPIECDPKQNVMRNLFIQPGNSVSAYPDDPRFSAIGNFQIATAGMQATSVIGELWVSYHVKLYKPQLETSVGLSSTSGHMQVIQTSTTSTNLSSFVFSKPGAVTCTLTISGLKLTCGTSIGIGAYIIARGMINSDSGGNLNLGSSGPNSTLSGSAAYVLNNFGPTGLVGATNSDWFNVPLSTASGYSPVTYNRCSAVTLFKFQAVGDTITLPIYSNAGGSTIYHDFYLTPYTVPLLAAVKPEKVSEDEGKWAEMKQIIAELKAKQASTDQEFVALKNEILDEMEDGEVVTPCNTPIHHPVLKRGTPITLHAVHRKDAQALLNASQEQGGLDLVYKNLKISDK